MKDFADEVLNGETGLAVVEWVAKDLRQYHEEINAMMAKSKARVFLIFLDDGSSYSLWRKKLPEISPSASCLAVQQGAGRRTHNAEYFTEAELPDAVDNLIGRVLLAYNKTEYMHVKGRSFEDVCYNLKMTHYH